MLFLLQSEMVCLLPLFLYGMHGGGCNSLEKQNLECHHIGCFQLQVSKIQNILFESIQNGSK